MSVVVVLMMVVNRLSALRHSFRDSPNLALTLALTSVVTVCTSQDSALLNTIDTHTLE